VKNPSPPSEVGAPELETIKSTISQRIPSARMMDLSHYARTVTDKNGVILYANEAFCRVTGYSLEEAIGMSHRLLNAGHHPREFFEELWRTLKIEKRAWHGEIRNRRKDGTLFWEEAEILPVLDDRGEVQYFLSEKKDITERKRLEEEREIALKLNRRAVENARILQRQMITEKLPLVPGYTLSALYIPSEMMSGDLFIVREHEGRLPIILGDCTGHGVEASMNANLLWRFMYRFEHMLHEPVPRISAFLESINRKMIESRTEETGYPTVMVAVIDTAARLLHYGGAGGIPPLLFKGQQVRPIEAPRGIVLAVTDAPTYETHTVALESGDTLLLASDAIYEEREHHGGKSVVNGEAFFRAALAHYPDGSYIENIRYLFTQFAGVPRVDRLQDDVSMVLVRVLSEEEERAGRNQLGSHTLFL